MPASYIDFVEERLEIGIDYGVVGGPSFKTEILESGSGKEQRNQEMWQPKGRWQLGDRMLLDSNIERINEVLYLKDFHSARKGSKQGFRFKDWCDYRGINQYLGTTDGVTTRWQLKKTYQIGSEFTFRPILKPVQGTVKLYLDGVEITYPLINYSNGLISFAVPPQSGQLLTADFEFDVPVKFEADKVEWTLKAMQLGAGEFLHKLGSVFVKEMRIDPDLEWYRREPIPQLIAEPLDLGFILDVNETVTFSTREEKLDSGFTRDESNGDIVKTLIKLPAKNFDQQELDKILAYFWLAKGRLVNLTLILNDRTRTVRFDSDTLSIKFLAKEDEDSLYEVNLTYLELLNQKSFIILLDLTGEDYRDRSELRNQVNIVGDVPIVRDAFKISHAGNNHLLIPNHPEFALLDNYFSIEFELKMLSPTVNNLNFLSQRGRNNNQFFTRLFNNQIFIDITSSGVSSTAYHADLPDDDYLTSFQTFKIERNVSPNEDAFDAFIFYYKGQLIGFREIDVTRSYFPSTANVTVGKVDLGSNFAEEYLIRNLRWIKYI